MQKCLAWILVFLLFPGASARTAFAASAEHDAERAAKVKLQIDSFAPGTPVKVKLKDRRKIKGRLVDRTEGSFQLNTPQLTEINYTEVKSVAEAPGDQAIPGNNQYPPRHHSHLLRNGLIAFGVCFAFALVVAVASK